MPNHPSLKLQDGVILAIETSNPSSWTPDSDPAHLVMPGIAALVVSKGLSGPLAIESCDPRERDDTLLPAIDRLLRSLGCGPADLRAVVVSIGPGGFTALRIAAAAAKMLAISTGAALFAVPSARVAAQAASSGSGPLAVAIASKGDDAWVECFADDEEHTRLGEPAIMNAGDMPTLAARGVVRLIADRFLPTAMREAAVTLGLAIEPPTFAAAACLRAARATDRVSPAALTPIYPRPPEAVRKWREIHPDQSRVPPMLLPPIP